MKNELNDPITIDAKLLVKGNNASKFECEGDIAWFPNKLINWNPETESLEVERWKLMQTFPGENY